MMRFPLRSTLMLVPAFGLSALLTVACSDASPTGATPLPTSGLNATVSSASTGCVLPQGAYKNEFSWMVVQSGGVVVGSVPYTPAQINQIFRTPVAGNGLISLAYQVITARLNIYFGASAPSSVLAAISSADALIGSLVVPPIGSGYLKSSLTSSLTTVLGDFNNGKSGTPRCD